MIDMIYLVGGAPRAGKSILAQQISTKLQVGWVSTDLLLDLLRVKKDEGVKREWNAAPEASWRMLNGSSCTWSGLSGVSARSPSITQSKVSTFFQRRLCSFLLSIKYARCFWGAPQ